MHLHIDKSISKNGSFLCYLASDKNRSSRLKNNDFYISHRIELTALIVYHTLGNTNTTDCSTLSLSARISCFDVNCNI